MTVLGPWSHCGSAPHCHGLQGVLPNASQQRQYLNNTPACCFLLLNRGIAMANFIYHYLKPKQTSTGCYKCASKMSCAGNTDRINMQKAMEAEGGSTSPSVGFHKPRPLSWARHKCFDDLYHHQPLHIGNTTDVFQWKTIRPREYPPLPGGQR